MTIEPTQLHYITGDELRLLQSYRLMGQQDRVATLYLAESLAEPQVNLRIENVVPIRPTAKAFYGGAA